MSRIQLALNVDDIDQAVAFYSTLFATEPAKRKPGYANFAVTDPPLKLVLIENPGHGGSVNHLGVEVETSEKVHAEIARLSEAGLFTEEQLATTCCFATQHKVWITAPDKERWEVYTVLADSETFGTAPELTGAATPSDAEAVQACCGTAEEAAAEGACCTPAAKKEAIASGATCCS
ncbi:ArsI/CadI family heavy metal resistance metalloenzyme [Nocardia sp. CDC186]|uniref:ArsI/CadI family heavy metal resistance metalloenzyme n=2 Tax=Nocardia implantans TaxID=3108168 RepID=A0ABU6B2M3_9NOCA|nr:ArsI/CadI family heavy metal resistance metalloenzyme [Nocardia sp. CDC186]MBF6195915.1 VOC family protein [Nocardia beijingensis]MEB3513959.1 ArsI/CadI family heavy metal resistance metalloenzyme [Nocardia sp. CDC186]